jgi:hypothetical protein
MASSIGFAKAIEKSQNEGPKKAKEVLARKIRSG